MLELTVAMEGNHAQLGGEDELDQNIANEEFGRRNADPSVRIFASRSVIRPSR